eukprot:scaffold123339_cov66-Phaeocystis_antarctica.AAC.2
MAAPRPPRTSTTRRATEPAIAREAPSAMAPASSPGSLTNVTTAVAAPGADSTGGGGGDSGGGGPPSRLGERVDPEVQAVGSTRRLSSSRPSRILTGQPRCTPLSSCAARRAKLRLEGVI